MDPRRGNIVRDSALVGVLSFVFASFVAWLNWDHNLQGTIYRAHYLGLARFIRGEGDFEILTYPIWGFPAVLALTHYEEFWTIALQCLLASTVLVFLYSNTALYVRSRKLLFLLCVCAVPWFSLASAKAADIWSAGFGVLAILTLSLMFRKGSMIYALLAGILFGIACNFRSDYFAFAFGLPLGVAILAPSYLKAHVKHFVLLMILVPASLVPWGLFRVAHGEPFGITSTNSGMVLVNSLGFEGNQWGILRHDRQRVEELKDARGESTLPWSVEGNDFFQQRWLDAIRDQPGEFVRMIPINFLTALRYGFYNVEIEPYLRTSDAVEFEVFKEQLKITAGASANHLDIEEFRKRGIWDDDFSLGSVSPRMWAIASLGIGTAVVSGVFLVILLFALGRLVFLDRTRLSDPLFLSCSIGVIYVWILIGLLQIDQRQLNVLYVLGIPLVVDLFDRLVCWMRNKGVGSGESTQ